MLKSLFYKSLMLSCIVAVAGCQKNNEVDTNTPDEESTSPHAMQNDPVMPDNSSANNQMHDDIENGTSAPVLMDNGASTVTTNSSTEMNSSTQ